MTPALREAIRLLQLSRLELIEAIRKECAHQGAQVNSESEP